jgi:hypothetical protein
MSEVADAFLSYGLLMGPVYCTEGSPLNDMDLKGCWYGDQASSGRALFSGPAVASKGDVAHAPDVCAAAAG